MSHHSAELTKVLSIFLAQAGVNILKSLSKVKIVDSDFGFKLDEVNLAEGIV